jgi:hypothetical protein
VRTQILQKIQQILHDRADAWTGPGAGVPGTASVRKWATRLGNITNFPLQPL